MNSENFHEYLKNPSKLHQVSYQELKSLVLQYPFSPNLRYLLWLKSMMEHHKEYDRNFTTASVYSLDRKKLWQLMKQHARLQEIQENYALTEDYLELRDLSVLENLAESPSTIFEEDEPMAQQLQPEAPLFEPTDFEPVDAEIDDIEPAAFEPIDFKPADFEHLPDEDEKEDPMIEEDLDLLEELLENTHINDSGNAAPDPEHSPQGGEQILEEHELPLDDVEDLGSLSEEDEPIEDFQGETPPVEFSEELLQPESDLETWPDELEAETTEIPEIEASQDYTHNDADVLFEEEDDLSGKTLEDILEENTSEEQLGAGENLTDPKTTVPFEITNDLADQDETLENLAPFNKQPQPIPKESYNTWLQKLRPPKVSTLQAELNNPAIQPEPQPEDQPGVDEDKAKQIAQQSITEDNTIASETLAVVLAMQGHKEKAIAMYERLCLQYPEKSSFFAAKIKELKK